LPLEYFKQRAGGVVGKKSDGKRLAARGLNSVRDREKEKSSRECTFANITFKHVWGARK
jgi:hypothetical protein